MQISGSERIENSNSIDPKFTRLIDDPVSSDGSSLNKNCLDKSGSGAIMPTLDTSKQLGGQLLSPNEINVCIPVYRTKMPKIARFLTKIDIIKFQTDSTKQKINFFCFFFLADMFNIQFTANDIYYNESGIFKRKGSCCSNTNHTS